MHFDALRTRFGGVAASSLDVGEISTRKPPDFDRIFQIANQ
jgi:hypothetical protein